MDTISKDHRSWNMSRIRSKNTTPELRVRKILHKAGYRYSLYNKNLPSKPDLVLRKYRLVVFVNGCFWHCHKGCKRSNIPKTNRKYWINKIARNIAKISQSRKALKKLGWSSVVIWECQTKDANKILRLLKYALRKVDGK